MTQPESLTPGVNLPDAPPAPGSLQEKELVRKIVAEMQAVKLSWLHAAACGADQGLGIRGGPDTSDELIAWMRRVWDQVIADLMAFELGMGLLEATSEPGVWRWIFGPKLIVSVKRRSSAENRS